MESNALLDYISVKVSKFMAEKILKDLSFIDVLLHLLYDLIIAIVFFTTLYLLMKYSIPLLDGLVSQPIDINEMLPTTMAEFFSIKYGWVTFMLISTLVPTFMHLVIALGAVLLKVFPAQNALMELERYQEGQEAMLESSAHYFTRIFFGKVFFSFMILGIIFLIIHTVKAHC